MRYAAVLVLLCGCGSDLPGSKEQALVGKYILEKAHDPKSIAFAKWGPHDLGELKAKWPAAGERKNAVIVRALYRGNNAVGALILNDHLFILSDGKVQAVEVNNWGDDWKEHVKNALTSKKSTGFVNFGIFY